MADKHVVTRQVLGGQAPVAIQEFAARGLLPLPRAEFLDVWVYLAAHGGTPEVRDLARQSLEQLSTEELVELAAHPHLEDSTFEYLVQRHSRDAAVAARLARNPGIPDAALVHLAEQAGADVLELIVVNQVRLLQTPDLLPALRRNPNLTSVQQRRLREFEEEFVHKEVRYELKVPAREAPSPMPTPSPVVPVGPSAPSPAPVPPSLVSTGPSAPAPTPEASAAVLTAPRPVPSVEVAETMETPPEVLAVEAETQGDPQRLLDRIMRMTIPERIMLALLGHREARMFLIRDPNRIVQEAVMKSPRLSESEAETYAAMRHLEPDVLRILADRREFHKNRTFLYRIVTNPKTPIPIATRLMAQLSVMQLRDITRSRDVPMAVRNMAKERLAHILGLGKG
ncbi:MAG: hypothetical protein NZ742_03725 [Acidobacteria bacterium]|nr:hypothetical protein [Acidobacteriota bacterium]MDW7983275.1 hypothetical protein [Acidobacteriota bacterium]